MLNILTALESRSFTDLQNNYLYSLFALVFPFFQLQNYITTDNVSKFVQKASVQKKKKKNALMFAFHFLREIFDIYLQEKLLN